MAMEAVDNFIMPGLTFRHYNGLGKTVHLQRFTEQPFFRRGNVVGVVIVRGNLVLFDPQYAVDRLFAKRAIFMDGLAKGVNGFNAFIFGKRLKIIFISLINCCCIRSPLLAF